MDPTKQLKEILDLIEGKNNLAAKYKTVELVEWWRHNDSLPDLAQLDNVQVETMLGIFLAGVIN